MNLKELKERIDKMYNKYGDIAVVVDLVSNEDIDDTICLNEGGSKSTENIQDITELKDYKGEEVVGICLSNYVMEDNNWGKDE